MKLLHLELAIMASCDMAWHDFIVDVSPFDIFIDPDAMAPLFIDPLCMLSLGMLPLGALELGMLELGGVAVSGAVWAAATPAVKAAAASPASKVVKCFTVLSRLRTDTFSAWLQTRPPEGGSRPDRRLPAGKPPVDRGKTAPDSRARLAP